MVFIHFNAEGCNPVKRGRVNTKKGGVIKALGATHTELVLTEKAAVTVDNVLELLSKCGRAQGAGARSGGMEALVRAQVVLRRQGRGLEGLLHREDARGLRGVDRGVARGCALRIRVCMGWCWVCWR